LIITITVKNFYSEDQADPDYWQSG